MRHPIDTRRSPTRVAAVLAIVVVMLGGAGPASAQSPSGTSVLPPDGTWQVELSPEDLSAAGWTDVTPPGTYSWTFGEGRARLELRDEAGALVIFCDAAMAAAGDAVRFTYAPADCAGEDTIRWALDDAGLHLALVATTGGADQQHAYLETKPWQRAAVPGATAVPWLSRCGPGCQGPVGHEPFTSAGYRPGLGLTFIDDTWFNAVDHPNKVEFERFEERLIIWDVEGAVAPTGELLTDVPSTPADLAAWSVANPEMVVSEPESVTLGDLDATTFTVGVSETNVNDDPECPSGVRSCLNLLVVANSHVHAIGYGETVRFYLLQVGSGGEARTLAITLDAPTDARLTTLTTDLQPVLASLRIPPP